MACAAAISTGLIVGILALSLIVFTAVVVRRRKVAMKWKDVVSTDELRMDEHKVPLYDAKDGVESNIAT